MNDPSDQSRVVLVTGAGGGLGRGLVGEFSAAGWRVVAAHHRDPGPADSSSVWPVALEVTDRRQVEEVLDRILDRFGRLDALINNAGRTEDRLVTQMSDGEWQRVLDANLKGAFLCSRAVLRPMMKQRDGHIINISSHSARTGHAGQASYAAAKAGLIGLTQSLARELGSRNIRANAVMPGILPTAMTAALPAERLAALAAENALGRINEIGEVARFVVFLARLRNVSGQVFQLDSRIGAWV